ASLSRIRLQDGRCLRAQARRSLASVACRPEVYGLPRRRRSGYARFANPSLSVKDGTLLQEQRIGLVQHPILSVLLSKTSCIAPSWGRRARAQAAPSHEFRYTARP